jgi:ABC-type multidrug transport system permease subunit
MSWLGIWLGLMVPSVEVAQQAIFTVLFPITFLSNVFVPPQTLPDWLQPIAEWNPTSTLTGSLRQLWGNPNPFATDSFPSQNPVLVTLVWVVVVIAIFAPLGIRRYRNLSR